MFYEPYIIIIILVITMGLFIWGRWRYDVIALIALLLGVLLKAVPFNQVYTGLSNPAVITVACVMVISSAITQSGFLYPIVRRVSHIGHHPILHVGVLTLTSAILSAFMNNVGALALMMPIAIHSAKENNQSPSLVLLPIALGSAMGGLTTLIGTPPNLLISTYREQVSGQPFSMFDFSHVGIYLAISGVIYITFLGWRLIDKKNTGKKQSNDLYQIEDYITEVKIEKQSPMIDKPISELETLTASDYIIIGVIRNQKKRLNITEDLILQANDILIIEASAPELEKIIHRAKFSLVGDITISEDLLTSADITLLEAVVPQASRLEGRSCKSLRLRSRYNVNVIAVSRQGTPFKERLNSVKLQGGDIVLLQGHNEQLQDVLSRFDLLPLEERGLQFTKSPKSYLSIVFFVIAIVLSALHIMPVEVAFGGVVLFIMLFSVIPIRKIYDGIDWPVIILLAAMIPIGEALQSTGGTALIAHYVLSSTQDSAPIITLALLMIVTMTLSDFMNNAATTVVMAPIAISIAQGLHVNTDPFLMGVAISASCSFLTPVGHQNNTIVMGPGGYKFTDYIRIGLPLEILVLAISIPVLVRAWPL